MILDGKKVSNEIIENIKERINSINKDINFAIIWIGNDQASEIYVNNKIKKCNYVGITANLYHFDNDVQEEVLVELIKKLNEDDTVYGILIQSPIPAHLDEKKLDNLISLDKDIDGFSNKSIGNLALGLDGFVSCTPKGIMKMLDYYNISVSGKHVVIINRSNIVGKPLFNLMINNNATVTMCHSYTKNLNEYTKCADILISAVGKPNFIKADMIKEGAVVIDVGISRVEGKVVGDVSFDEVRKKASYITPVPGGIGPMTIAMVLDNILWSVERKN